MLSREEILAIEDRVTEEVDVPQWGGKVFVRSLDGPEAAELFRLTEKSPSGADRSFMVALVICATVDAEGRRLFTIQDAPTLARKNYAALQRVYAVAARLSGFSQEGRAELEKKSAATPGSENGSGSPPSSTAESLNSRR